MTTTMRAPTRREVTHSAAALAAFASLPIAGASIGEIARSDRDPTEALVAEKPTHIDEPAMRTIKMGEDSIGTTRGNR